MHTTLLSTAGSDRATGYLLSNKLVRHGDTLYAGWLDAPGSIDAPCHIRLGVCDAATGALRDTLTLGPGYDNHCGPALALDREKRLHAILGAHSGTMRHLWTPHPAGDTGWSRPIDLGPKDSYPSLVADFDGTLHLVHRESGERWQLWYRRKPAGRDWEPPRALAVSPEPGYNHFMQTISAGPDGTLHLFFQFHYGPEADSPDQKGKYAAYLHSRDGGDTWFNEDQPCEFPLTIDTVRAFRHRPAGGIRIGGHVVDAQNRPWIHVCLPDRPGGELLRRDANGWTRIDLSASLDKLNLIGGHARDVALTRDAAGQIHLIAATPPSAAPAAWFDPRHELFHLVLTEDGRTLSFRQITETDPARAHWLPALENWDWTRASACCVGGPWLLFTRGLNLGGLGGENVNTLKTEVHLTHLHLPNA